MCGNMFGNMRRNVPVIICGNVFGNMLGNVSRNTPSNVFGNMHGNVPVFVVFPVSNSWNVSCCSNDPPGECFLLHVCLRQEEGYHIPWVGVVPSPPSPFFRVGWDRRDGRAVVAITTTATMQQSPQSDGCCCSRPRSL